MKLQTVIQAHPARALQDISSVALQPALPTPGHPAAPHVHLPASAQAPSRLGHVPASAGCPTQLPLRAEHAPQSLRPLLQPDVGSNNNRAAPISPPAIAATTRWILNKRTIATTVTRRQYERGYESVQADGLCSEVELLLRECKLD